MASQHVAGGLLCRAAATGDEERGNSRGPLGAAIGQCEARGRPEVWDPRYLTTYVHIYKALKFA